MPKSELASSLFSRCAAVLTFALESTVFKPGKVALVLQGRFAGRKVVVIRQSDEGTKVRIPRTAAQSTPETDRRMLCTHRSVLTPTRSLPVSSATLAR